MNGTMKQKEVAMPQRAHNPEGSELARKILIREPMASYATVAKLSGVSRERVRQIAAEPEVDSVRMKAYGKITKQYAKETK